MLSYDSCCVSGVKASVLQKAEVRIINSTVCKGLMSDVVTDRMLCAGVLKGGVDACQVRADHSNMSAHAQCGSVGYNRSDTCGPIRAVQRCVFRSVLLTEPDVRPPLSSSSLLSDSHRATPAGRCQSLTPVGGSSWRVW